MERATIGSAARRTGACGSGMAATFAHNIMLTGPFLARDGAKVNLGLNESPYSIPDSVKRAAIAALDRLNEYPLGHQERVMEAVERRYGVAAGSVAFTRGVDEALDRVIELYPRMRYVLFRPTFIGYEARLRLAGVDHVVVPYDEGFRIREGDVASFRKSDLVVLASPNNPTGAMVDRATLERVRAACGKVFLDEAYIDFAGAPSSLGDVDGELFVFRSLSKVFALAGQRLGFLFGAPGAIAEIRNRQWFCNVDRVSLDVVAAIMERPYMAEYAARTVKERRRVTEAIRGTGLHVGDSHANFVLLRSPRAAAIVRHLDERGIVVMDTSVFGLADHARITIGTPAQNDLLLAALRTFPG